MFGCHLITINNIPIFVQSYKETIKKTLNPAYYYILNTWFSCNFINALKRNISQTIRES